MINQKSSGLLTLLAFSLVFLGMFVMLSWIFNIGDMIEIFMPPMQFNAALCFSLAGLTVFLYQKNRCNWVSMVNAFILVIAVLTLVEFLFKINIGIDHWFIPSIEVGSSTPGRMSSMMALSFMLFAVFMFTIQLTRNKFLFFLILLPFSYGVLGFISLMGYAFHFQTAYASGSFPHIPLPSAIALIILAIISIFLLKTNKELSKNQVSRIMDYCIFFAVVVFFIVFWQVVRMNYVDFIKTKALHQELILRAKLTIEVDRDVKAIQRLFARINTNSYASQNALKHDIQFYFKHMNALEEVTITKNTVTNPYINIQKMALENQCKSAEPAGLIMGGNNGYLCMADKKVSVIINLNTIVSYFIHQQAAQFIVSVENDNHVIFQNGKEADKYKQFTPIRSKINFYGKPWYITIYPSQSYVKKTVGNVPILILGLGGFISLLILFILQYKRKLLSKEKALLTEEALKTTILNSTLEGVLGVDKHFRVYFMNKAAQKLLNINFDSQKKIILSELIQKSENSIEVIQQSLREGISLRKEADIFYKLDGSLLPVRYSSSPIIDNSKVTGAIIVFTDNTERLEYEKKLKQLAHYDSLTNLPNRFSILTHLTQCIARVKRHQFNFSLCFIDIDKFKSINDNYGHHVGDAALKYVASVILKYIRQNDFLGRLSGDEFCLILEGIHSEEEARPVLDKIHQHLKKPLQVGDVTLELSLSIGVIPHKDEDIPEELLIKADAAMYSVKKSI